MKPNFLLAAAVLGALAVLLGALVAHALKPLLNDFQQQAFETAVRYQFFHAFALIGVHLLDPAAGSRVLKRAGYLFLAGVVCFSGSIYLLATHDWTGWNTGFLGPVTPLGGVLMITGWIHMAVYAAGRLRKS